MKKHIVFILTSVFLLSTVFYACTQEGIPQENTQEIELDNFEADLQAVFKTVSKSLPRDQKLKKTHLTALFLQSSLAVFPGVQTEESFKDQYLSRSLNHPKKNKTRDVLENLVNSSADADQVIQTLSKYLTSDAYLLQQKKDFLVLIECIEFLSQNQDILGSHFSQAKKRSTHTKSACSWWDSWGGCTSGIIAGAIGGASAGCEAGEDLSGGNETGCVVGGTIGAVAGGIVGALENCGGCSN